MSRLFYLQNNQQSVHTYNLFLHGAIVVCFGILNQKVREGFKEVRTIFFCMETYERCL